jgi:hypothetical protein
MKLITINDENALAIIVKGSLLLLVVLALAGFLLISTRFAVSTVAGGTLALLNYCWLRSIMERILAEQSANASRYALIRYLLRLFLLGLAIVALFRFGVDIAGLLTGLSILVITIMSVSVYLLVQRKGD